MVVVTFTYLIAECYELSVFIKVCTLHIEVIEPVKDVFHMFLCTCILVSISEFLITPSES